MPPFYDSRPCAECGKTDDTFSLVVQAAGTSLCAECLMKMLRFWRDEKLGQGAIHMRTQRV